MRLGILYNPAAGRGRARQHVDEAEGILRQAGAEVTHLESRSRDHMIDLAGRVTPAEFDRVVVVGGDGTVHLALRKLDLSIPMAIIPLGSGDDFAKTVEIPRSVGEACRVVVEGRIREVDVAEANGLRYLGVAGIGFDSLVASEANRVKVVGGSAVYLYSIFKVLPAFEPIPMKITVDDKTFSEEIMFVVVGNTHRYGGGIEIAPAALVDDGVLDMYVISKCSKWDLIKTLPKGYTGKHVSSPFVRHHPGTRFRIEADVPLELNADGEPVTHTPVEIGFAAGKLKILVP